MEKVNQRARLWCLAWKKRLAQAGRRNRRYIENICEIRVASAGDPPNDLPCDQLKDYQTMENDLADEEPVSIAYYTVIYLLSTRTAYST